MNPVTDLYIWEGAGEGGRERDREILHEACFDIYILDEAYIYIDIYAYILGSGEEREIHEAYCYMDL